MAEYDLSALEENIQDITDALYQQRVKEGLETIPLVLKQLSTIAMQLDEEKETALLSILKNAMDALEEKEYVLLADILYFDVRDCIAD